MEGYTDPGITRLAIDWTKVPSLVLDPMSVPDITLVNSLAKRTVHWRLMGQVRRPW